MKVIVANINKQDQHGDIILPGAIKNCSVLLTKDFNAYKPIGKCKITFDNEHIFAEIENVEEFKGLYPAIGFISKHTKRIGEVRELHSIELLEVSLCSSPNVDETIKPIL